MQRSRPHSVAHVRARHVHLGKDLQAARTQLDGPRAQVLVWSVVRLGFKVLVNPNPSLVRDEKGSAGSKNGAGWTECTNADMAGCEDRV